MLHSLYVLGKYSLILLSVKVLHYRQFSEQSRVQSDLE